MDNRKPIQGKVFFPPARALKEKVVSPRQVQPTRITGRRVMEIALRSSELNAKSHCSYVFKTFVLGRLGSQTSIEERCMTPITHRPARVSR